MKVLVTMFTFTMFQFSGEIGRFQSGDEDNFSQPREFWEKVLNDKERTDLVSNIAGHLKNAQEFLRIRAVSTAAAMIGFLIVHYLDIPMEFKSTLFV